MLALLGTVLASLGNIASARSFLNKAKETLTALKDEEPPKVQVITYEEKENLITVEGYASDNTKVKNVSVNNSLIDVSEEGKFLYKTIPTDTLKQISQSLKY